MIFNRGISILAILALALPAVATAQPVKSKAVPASQAVVTKAGASNASAAEPARAGEAPQWGPLGFHATWVRPDWRPPVRNPGSRKASHR